MMLQKITFNEVKENVALVDKKHIRTRAHDGISCSVMTKNLCTRCEVQFNFSSPKEFQN